MPLPRVSLLRLSLSKTRSAIFAELLSSSEDYRYIMDFASLVGFSVPHTRGVLKWLVALGLAEIRQETGDELDKRKKASVAPHVAHEPVVMYRATAKAFELQASLDEMRKKVSLPAPIDISSKSMAAFEVVRNSPAPIALTKATVPRGVGNIDLVLEDMVAAGWFMRVDDGVKVQLSEGALALIAMDRAFSTGG